jgi:transcriptional regulator GlxA family with amidase domain
MPNKRPLIALLAAPNTSSAVLYGLYDILYSVGAVYPDMTIGDPGIESLEVRIVSENGEPFRCVGNILVEPHNAISDVPSPDAVVVCDMYSSIHEAPTGRYPLLSTWLSGVHSRGGLVASVCSGALVLAEAGLLDHREAAAHWAYGVLFEQAYPNVRLRKGSILCLSSAADRIVTAGGVTSWQDLALYLIAHFCGTERASQTAKVYLLSGHEDGQLPFAAMNRRVNRSDSVIADCQEWIALNYAQTNPVQTMIQRTGIHPRTLSRRFLAATGRSPLEYVQEMRMEEAKQMLEVGSEPIEEISMLVGYEDAAAFRRLFKRLVGITPSTYRRRFANGGRRHRGLVRQSPAG